MSKRKKHKEIRKDKVIGLGRYKYVDFLLIPALFLIIFLVNLPLANVELMQPDGSGYLDMGRNLFSGKGPVISSNLNQYWPGKYYPFLPYMQPLYGIIAGLIWLLFGLKAVIGFNILLHAVNCVLLYKIIRIYEEKFLSFAIALFMGFSMNLIFSAIAPLTEHLHLFFVLLAIFVYLRYKNTHLVVGIILAISCLVRASSLYNVLAFAIAIIALEGFSKQALRDYFKLSASFLIVFLSYEIFCYLRYGAFYPEYLIAAKIYRSAEIYPGAFYTEGTPVLNTPPLELSIGTLLTNARNNFLGIVDIFMNIKFAIFLVPIYFIVDLVRKRKNPLLMIFFFQGILILLAFTLGHAWSPVYEFSRFSTIPYVMLGAIGFLILKEIIHWFSSDADKRLFAVIFAIVISLFFYLEMKNYLLFKKHWGEIYLQKQTAYRENRDKIHEWIKANTKEDDLIASDLLADSFLLERPFVSLPPGKALNEKNLNDFLNIYKPEYVLTYNETVADYLKSIGFKELKRRDILILLSRE